MRRRRSTVTQATLADVFGLERGSGAVSSPFVGGGFGNKLVWDHQILAIAAAKLARRPVRLVLSREEVFRATGGRTNTEQRVALAAREDGSGLAALIHTGVAANSPLNEWPEQFTFPARHLYAADAMKIGQEVLRLDMMANCPMRAPGESVGSFALESALDELAVALVLDPIELRRRIEPEKDPTSGRAFSSRHLLKAYQDGAERFGWDGATRRPARGARASGWWAWAWRPRPTPTTACRAAPRASGSPLTGARWCRWPATRWAWGLPRCRRSTPPSGWGCRWTGCASSTATRTCRPARWPAALRRPPRSRPPSPRRTTSWSASC